VRSLLDDGRQLGGLEGVVASDVPVGAGLSSSAALEVALVLALTDPPPELTDIARICRRAENEYVGVGSGIMDPLAAAGSVARAAMLIDCRSLERRTVPIPGGLSLLVVDGSQRRELASGAYERSAPNAPRPQDCSASHRCAMRPRRWSSGDGCLDDSRRGRATS
jgi:galactokinase